MRPLNMHRRKPLGFRRQRGAVAILLTVAMVALVAMAGLTLDGGHLMLNKSRLQNAVDAAALSGAKTLSQTYGVAGAATATRDAALNTLRLNADAEGNGELARAIAERGGVGNFANVEFSTSVYGPFAAGLPANARYVRVTVANHGLVGFFWRFLDSIGAGDLGEKRVAAVATAGPSPTQPCDLMPLMVCGDVAQPPSSGKFWGHGFGDLKVLKSTDWRGSGTGPGTYQLLDLLETGGSGVRDALAGGVSRCYSPGDMVPIKPGNTAGPTRQGFNTRFEGGSHPPDLVTSYTQKGSKGLELEGNEKKGTEYIAFDKSKVTWDSQGNIRTEDGRSIDGYNEWRERTAKCLSGTGSGCKADGVAERRMLKIVIADCSNTSGKSVKVLGVGCFFALQPMASTGLDEIFGQFVKECSADGYPGPNPSADAGPQIIQLYKSYIGSGVGVPSNDS